MRTTDQRRVIHQRCWSWRPATSASFLFFEALSIHFLSFVSSLSNALRSSWIPILWWATESNRSLCLLIRRFFGFCPSVLKAFDHCDSVKCAIRWKRLTSCIVTNHVSITVRWINRIITGVRQLVKYILRILLDRFSVGLVCHCYL